MVDLRNTIIAKSDQLNADDIIGGPITIKIRDVTGGNGKDQPINIYYEGDNNKPWKPCKTMRRALIALWDYNGADYVGRYLTLYRDESVKWAGEEVGGIRISHASHINETMKLALAVSKGSKKKHVIEPLKNVPQQKVQESQQNGQTEQQAPQTERPEHVRMAQALVKKIREFDDAALLEDYLSDLDFSTDIHAVKKASEETAQWVHDQIAIKKKDLEGGK